MKLLVVAGEGPYLLLLLLLLVVLGKGMELLYGGPGSRCWLFAVN